MCGFAANSGGYSYAKDMYGELNIGYGPNPVIKDANYYYMGLHADLSFLNWKNKYTGQNSEGIIRGSDDFNFKSVIGLDIFAGYKFNNDMRADIEFGYMGKYTETETERNEHFVTEKTRFDISSYYLMANGYYDFRYGLYAGAGLGIAFVDVSLDHSAVQKKTETTVSPMGALMFGWAYKLDDKINLDLRYRFALFDGGDVNLDMTGGYYVKTDLGYVLDNTLSAGIRYNF